MNIDRNPLPKANLLWVSRYRSLCPWMCPADFSLFDGAMEFLVGEQEDDSNDEDEDEDFSTPPTSPMTSRLGLTRVAIETLPRVFCYERRHVQAVAVGLQVNNFHKLLPQRELESFSPASCYTGYFTLTMRGAHLKHTQTCFLFCMKLEG